MAFWKFVGIFFVRSTMSLVDEIIVPCCAIGLKGALNVVNALCRASPLPPYLQFSLKAVSKVSKQISGTTDRSPSSLCAVFDH